MQLKKERKENRRRRRALQTNLSGMVTDRGLVKVWGSYFAINNLFPQAPRVTPSALSQLLGWVQIEGDPNVGQR